MRRRKKPLLRFSDKNGFHQGALFSSAGLGFLYHEEHDIFFVIFVVKYIGMLTALNHGRFVEIAKILDSEPGFSSRSRLLKMNDGKCPANLSKPAPMNAVIPDRCLRAPSAIRSPKFPVQQQELQFHHRRCLNNNFDFHLIHLLLHTGGSQ